MHAAMNAYGFALVEGETRTLASMGEFCFGYNLNVPTRWLCSD